MAEAPSFAKLVPGFDFLQSLVKNAGSALPSIGQWVAPTLDPEELEKRIGELRTVQFWLEQNARMLEATIQALEVQRMTLSTLKTMNVQMEDLRDSLQIRLPEALKAAPAAAPATGADGGETGVEASEDAEDGSQPPAEAARQRSKPAAGRAAAAPKAAARAGASSGPVDPLQWWGALTKQFTELAANAMKDSTAEAAKSLAGQAVKHSIEAAGAALKSAGAYNENKRSEDRSTGVRRAGATAAKAPAAPRRRAAAKR
jgi:hypothetical protein